MTSQSGDAVAKTAAAEWPVPEQVWMARLAWKIERARAKKIVRVQVTQPGQRDHRSAMEKGWERLATSSEWWGRGNGGEGNAASFDGMLQFWPWSAKVQFRPEGTY